MARISPPCKPDCPDRHIGCQGAECKAYMDFKAEIQAQKKWLNNYRYLSHERVGRILDDIASTSPRRNKRFTNKTRRKKVRKA